MALMKCFHHVFGIRACARSYFTTSCLVQAHGPPLVEDQAFSLVDAWHTVIEVCVHQNAEHLVVQACHLVSVLQNPEGQVL